MAFVEQRGVRHQLAEAPVDGGRAGGQAAPVVIDALHLLVQHEALRHAVHLRRQLLQPGEVEAGVRRGRPLVAEVGAPIDEQRRVRLMHQALGHMGAGIQGFAVACDPSVRVAGLDGALGKQPLRIDRPRGGMRVDRRVHERLRLHRLLGLVVAAAAIANEVDDGILLELHPVIHGDLGDEHHRLRIVRVHMEDGRPHHLGHFGAVFRGAGVIHPMRGEADLVVDDDVQRAAGVEAARLRHLERLHHHALARKRGVAVNHHRHDEVAGVVAPPVLPRPHRALHHGRHDLQMRRVEREHHMHLAARRLHVGGKALVVLDVAHANVLHAAFELVEQIARILAEDVHQHVEAAAVRHADDGFHHAVGAGALQRLVEHGKQALATLQAEALGAGIPGVQVFLQPFGGGQALQQHPLGVRAEGRRGAGALQALPQPALLGRFHMDVLDADRAAIGALQGIQDVPERCLAAIE